MPLRARASLSLIVLAVVAITGVAACLGLADPSRTIGGTAGRAVPYQAPPVQDLASLALAAAQTNNLSVPITPCRIVDTRKGGGKLASGATRNFRVSGTTGFAAQGGKATGCGIPANATAIAISIVATNAAANGFLTAWPVGATRPTASVLNFHKAQTTNTGATIAIKPNANPALAVYGQGGPADIVIDVTGYQEPQMHGLVSPASSGDSTHSAPIYAGSSRIVSATNPSDGVYVVTFDGTITYCTPMVDTYNAGPGVYGAAYAFSANTATAFTWYLSATTHLEVPFSFYFYIYLVC